MSIVQNLNIKPAKQTKKTNQEVLYTFSLSQQQQQFVYKSNSISYTMSNNKRASPDAQTVEWKDTKIDDLTRKDLEKLFKSRHMEFKGLNKDEMVDKIKKDGDVIIDNPESLTNVELIAELRLRNLNDEASKKETLLARYRGEEEEPPRKKQRVGKKTKRKKSILLCNIIYTTNERRKITRK